MRTDNGTSAPRAVLTETSSTFRGPAIPSLPSQFNPTATRLWAEIFLFLAVHPFPAMPLLQAAHPFPAMLGSAPRRRPRDFMLRPAARVMGQCTARRWG